MYACDVFRAAAPNTAKPGVGLRNHNKTKPGVGLYVIITKLNQE